MSRHERGRAVVTERDLINGAVTHRDLDQPEATLPPIVIRVEAARRLRPAAEESCRDCWLRGRDAAIRAMLATGRVDAVVPTVSERHVLASFSRGVAMAKLAMEA